MKNVPFSLYRGGTSKGPFFLKKDLPVDIEERNEVIKKIVGTPHPYQVDGIGGGIPNATKVGILCSSEQENIDVEYIFAQVGVNTSTVDTTSDCGNMLLAAACFAIDSGLVKANCKKAYTSVTIYSPNTKSIKEVLVPCDHGQVLYEGDFTISGVAGTGAMIEAKFINPTASQTESIFPSGNRIDVIDNKQVTLIDCGRALVIADASSFNISKDDGNQSLESNTQLNRELEAFRLKCADRMGIENPLETFPRISLVSKSNNDKEDVYVRYWVSTSSGIIHPGVAMTAAMALGSATCIEGTLCFQKKHTFNDETATKTICIGHASGSINIHVTGRNAGEYVESCAYQKTARLLAKGLTYYKQ